MKCEDFEYLLSDALAGELAESDQAAFDAHLAACTACKNEHDSLAAAVGRMRLLPAAPRMSIRRVGDGLLLTPYAARSAPRWEWMRHSGDLLRYAAVILVAFTAGYGVNRFSTTGPVDQGASGVLRAPPAAPHRNLQSAVALQFSRNPARSDLAKGLLAMYGSH